MHDTPQEKALGQSNTVVGKMFMTERFMLRGIATGAAYADLDALGLAVSIDVPISGVIQSATYYDLDDEGLQVDLWLLSDKPTDQTDNSAVKTPILFFTAHLSNNPVRFPCPGKKAQEYKNKNQSLPCVKPKIQPLSQKKTRERAAHQNHRDKCEHPQMSQEFIVFVRSWIRQKMNLLCSTKVRAYYVEYAPLCQS